MKKISELLKFLLNKNFFPEFLNLKKNGSKSKRRRDKGSNIIFPL